MSAPMAEVLRELLEEVWDDGNAVGLDGWIGPGRGAGEVDPEAVRGRERVIEKVEAALAANGYGKLPATVTEWASAFRAAWARYNYHRTQAEAEDFVKEMKDVGADMVVITRQHTPATSTEWRQP